MPYKPSLGQGHNPKKRYPYPVEFDDALKNLDIPLRK